MYEVYYEETKDTLTQTCELYRLDANGIAYPVGGLSIFTATTVLLSTQTNLATTPVSDYLIYFGIWALLFACLTIFRHTFGRKLAKTKAIGDAEDAYLKRHPHRGNKLKISMHFFDQSFETKTQSQSVTYQYNQVTKLLESEDAFGIVIRTPAGPKGIYSFPKDSVNDGQYDALKDYLVSVCPKIKKIKKL